MEGIPVGFGVITPDILEKLKNPTDNSVEAHYGFDTKTINKHIGEMMKDLYIEESITDVIDKHFPNSDAEARLKVFAFALAFRYMHKGVWKG
jgi:hypothetical protein